MPSDDTDHDHVGRDPLAPDDLMAPPEPPEPPRGERPGHRAGELREPMRLPETSVRRIDHRDAGDSVIAGGFHDVTEPQSTMGATLADERRRQGKSLADVEAATRVRGRLIEALEKGEYDTLPSSAYVKGYIQSYADYLEIPSGPLVAQFNAETAGRDAAKATQHPYIRAPLPATSSGRRPDRSRSSTGRPWDLQLPGGKLWIWLLALVIVIALAAGIAGLVASRGEKAPPTPSTPVVETSTVNGNTGETTGSVAATGTASDLPTVTPSYTIFMKVKGGRSSRFRIIASNGNQLFVGQLLNAQSKTVTVTPSVDVTVRIGDPSAVAALKQNETTITVPSNSSKQVEIKLTKPPEQ
jgi:cytoskeletal protein RodZ